MKNSTRHLTLVLGDQLDRCSSALKDFDPKQDKVWMTEVKGEAEHVWSHKARIALFLSAMRHFRDYLKKTHYPLWYSELTDKDNRQTLGKELIRAVKVLKPKKLILVQPGDWRVQEEIKSTAKALKLPVEFRQDEHFLCSPQQFAEHRKNRKQLRMEFFYREMRQRYGILIKNGKPSGGQWNFDVQNRKSFGKSGPPQVPKPKSFPVDSITQKVLSMVEKEFSHHPGSLQSFDWPLTPKQAQASLKDFLKQRLELFGPYQDAMWVEEPYLYHSRLSAALNLKILNPRQVIEAAQAVLDAHPKSLASVEGFIRQILGWREYIHGMYWSFMPDYLERNFFNATQKLPSFYWNAKTEMNCLRQVIEMSLRYGYSHHIQRLMVTGLFALLLGVDPKQLHQWYLAIYVDAVEWVELPNTFGMSQYADGGLLASKPYVATGKYIQRMSNFCAQCPYRPEKSTGEDACPFTTLYWDFLRKHQSKLIKNPRMTLQLKNLTRLSRTELNSIKKKSEKLKNTFS